MASKIQISKLITSVVADLVVDTFVSIMKFLTSLPSPLTEICCCIIVYVFWLPVLFVPFLFVFAVRLMLSLIFQSVYEDKYKLMNAADVVHTFSVKGSVDTINFFIFINGDIRIEELRKRMKKALILKESTGVRPYWKLSHVPTVKFGFKSWEEMGDNIDLKHHVRYLPGASNPKQIYTEQELFEVASELACETFSDSRPKWEFLITPQVRVQNQNKSKVLSSILFRISHEYGDGISLMQLMRHVLFDQPIPKLIFDPVNPPIPPMPLHVKFIFFMQKLLLGPTCLMNFLSYRRRNETYASGPMVGPKYMGRTKMEIPLEMTRRIRKSLNCSTSALIHSAFCGAIRRLAVKKQLPVPKDVLGGMAHAVLPYPDEHLHNCFTPLAADLPLDIEDSLERLKETDKRLKKVVQPYSIETTYNTYRGLGIFPNELMELGVGDVECMYAISNVPGIVGTCKFDGNPVEMVFGTPPSCIGINFMIGLGCYDGKFTAGFIFNHSSLVSSKHELDEFIQEFEREVQILDAKSK